MTMTNKTETTSFYRLVNASIKEEEFILINVAHPDNHEKNIYCFTIGFNMQFNQPDVLIVGIEPDFAYDGIVKLKEFFKEGFTLNPGQKLDNLFSDPVVVYNVIPEVKEILAYQAATYYKKMGKKDYEMVILALPDENGVFPGEKGFTLTEGRTPIDKICIFKQENNDMPTPIN